MPDPFNPLKFGHDKLAKLGFSDPVNAASVLQSYLPPDIVSEVDWSSLKSEPTSFVSGQLEGSAADLLYSARLCQGSEIKIYVLLEHQSTVDGWMPLRLLGYMTQIWQASRKQDPEAKTLPLILPVVLFQGPKEWNVVTHLGGLIADWETLHPSMQRSIPDLHYSVIDLSRMKPGEMTGTTAARAVLEMLKGAAEGNLLETVRRCLPLLAALLQKGGQEAELVRAMWIYIMNVDGSAGMKDVQGVLERSQHPELEGNYMSTLEKLLNEREAEGEAKGEAKGIAEGEARGLALGQIQLFEELLGLEATPRETLAEKDLAALKVQLEELKKRFHRERS